MTSQEISKFVNQSKPRDVPKDILQAVYRIRPWGMEEFCIGILWVFIIIMSKITAIQGFVLSLVQVAAIFAVQWRSRRKLKHLLMEGRFATGRIAEVTRAAIVSFRDQYGRTRTGRCRLSVATGAICSRWVKEDRTLGLLYLPDQEDVLITDLWNEKN